MSLPDDVPEATAYFPSASYTLALDEGGERHREFENLLSDSERPLDRMDPSPLRASQQRWQRLVDQNHRRAEEIAQAETKVGIKGALERLDETFARRTRDLQRRQRRDMARDDIADEAALREAHTSELEALRQEHQRIETAIKAARPRLRTAMAVRMMKTKTVSG
ncbi:MAG: hypothetical protein R3C68_12815 [Myxococcota bacterium]